MLDSRLQLGSVNSPSWNLQRKLSWPTGQIFLKVAVGANTPHSSFRPDLEPVTCHCWTASTDRSKTGS